MREDRQKVVDVDQSGLRCTGSSKEKLSTDFSQMESDHVKPNDNIILKQSTTQKHLTKMV
jgi:hypothetical protein